MSAVSTRVPAHLSSTFMKDQSVSVTVMARAIEPAAHVRLTCTWKVATNITPSGFQSAEHATNG